MKVNPDQTIRLPKLVFQVCLTVVITAFACPDILVCQIPDNNAANIKIGILVPDSKSIAAMQGAELAVREANEKGGLNGRHFELVVRSMEGPWGTGSKEAVNLIFEEKVWALLGSHDGRNAHLVEQAATRSIVVFMSAWTSDPTLSQAFVPWFFNCVPNDNQQAASLIEEIYKKRKLSKVAVVSGDDYDSKIALDNFLKSVKKSGKPDPVKFSYDNYSLKPDALPDEIIKADANCIVLFCQPSVSIKIVQQIRQKKMNQPLFGSLMLLNENELSPQELQVYDNIISIPSGDWSGPENLAFRQKFQNTYYRMPGMVASYSYDGMSVLIEAIRDAGSSDREKIQKSLENIRYKGATGSIQFDDKGNRSGNFKMMRIKDGVPVSSE
ncbi:MAG: ABC transporter substrate-binding protein [Bacteroidales bacterium]|nr:ABC transporter substrate-binding protein [Bacteroidales bacterium]